MDPLRVRQRAMPCRPLAAVLAALISAPAFAQADEPSPPPMVPAEEPPPAEGAQPAPWTGQPEAQPEPEQQPQQFQQLPPYQPGQQSQRYSNAPLEDLQVEGQHEEKPPPPASQHPRTPRRAAPPRVERSGGWMESTRSRHVLGLLSGSLGLADTTAGAVGNARLEVDIARVSLLGSYSLFAATIPGLGGSLQVSQVNVMGGYAFFSSDLLTFRALAGVDIMTREGQTAVGPIVGSTLRSMWGRVGLDGAFMLTLLPYRQLEARATFVVQWWRVFEAHLGWRVQVVDATASGDLGTLFTSSPTISGPVVAVGLTL